MSMGKLIFLALLLPFSYYAYPQSYQELYLEGVTAYEQKNFKKLKKYMLAVDSMRPNYPPVIYHLASAYALLNEKQSALEKLNQFILMNAIDPFEQDEDFGPLSEEVAFHELIQKRENLMKEIPVSDWKRIKILNTHPETITYSKKIKSYLIGGVRDGKIWAIKEDGKPKVWTEPLANSWSILGLTISNDGKYLWVCTSALENFDKLATADKGKASVLKYDVKKGKLLATFTLPTIDHTFGHLVTDKKGNVYISDGTTNQVFVITKEKEELTLFADLSDSLFNMQGLCLDKEQTTLFIADYVDGIYRLNLETKKLEKLKIPTDVLLKGIDGLYYQNGSLIGMHNGTNPNRIVKYQLGVSETNIINKTILSQAGILDEPTQGVWVNGKLYYIVNSPWSAYDKKGDFSLEEENLIIGVVD